MKITPMMQQYRRIKAEYKEEVLFFRLGDFYEMFEEDAERASSILNVTLTSRNGIPMCGIPYHAAKNYIKKLLDADLKIAVCEQMEIPEKGIAEREVVQVISPGTVIDDDLLNSHANNYILAMGKAGAILSFSWIDLSTGEFTLSSETEDSSISSVKKIVHELEPAEVIIQEGFYYDDNRVKQLMDTLPGMVNPYPDWFFSIDDSYAKLVQLLHTQSLEPFGLSRTDPALFSAGVLIRYISENAKFTLDHIRSVRKFSYENYLQIDEKTQRNLEILKNLQDPKSRDTLFHVIDDTKTAIGSRKLRKWLVHPLKDHAAVEKRLDAVSFFYKNPETLNRIRTSMQRIRDIERLTARILIQRTTPKELLSLKESILSGIEVIAQLHELDDIGSFLSERDISELEEAASIISRSICCDDFAEEDDYLIKPGFDEELDQLRYFAENSLQVIDDYQQRLRNETKIQNLKIKYNKILGYFAEVSKSQISKVPNDGFIRKQTLVNAERYTTDELLILESQISNAQKAFTEKEKTVYSSVIQSISRKSSSIRKLAECLSSADCYQSFAFCAVKNGFNRPQFTDRNLLQITEGRHPVVEQNIKAGEFVPNSLQIPDDEKRFALITGPNMAGKSTYLRQNALIVLLAHVGSFVPAEEALIGPLDKIFCRVGASDNLAQGESTFLVEMNETAFILKNATENSLIIMDEVGRGTSTADGIALASSILYYLLEIRSMTLFSTHYHELTAIDSVLIQKLFLDVYENEGEIQFLNKVKPGSIQSSYGIHAAELAGLPKRVIARAKTFLKNMEENAHNKSPVQEQLMLFDGSIDESDDAFHAQLRKTADRILGIDIDKTTPMEALMILHELRKDLNRH